MVFWLRKNVFADPFLSDFTIKLIYYGDKSERHQKNTPKASFETWGVAYS
jgi:hypothetical protein